MYNNKRMTPLLLECDELYINATDGKNKVLNRSYVIENLIITIEVMRWVL